MLRTTLICLLMAYCAACSNTNQTTPSITKRTSYVDPFIGTGGHGHTYPGASMPFGMMQLSPDTRLEGWDGCSGYHYTDNYIYGFTHTHLSGTGVSDYGDILFMPTLAPEINNGYKNKGGYKTRFDHKNEIAQPGYYSVLLDSLNINVALTVSERSGMHKYTFPAADNQFITLDLVHRDKVLSAAYEQLNAKEIQGHRHSKAWSEEQYLFFYVKFSHDVSIVASNEDKDPMISSFKIDNPNNEPVYLTIGISAVDEVGAKQNAETEIGNKTFDQIRKEADAAWEKQLTKIDISSTDKSQKTVFYTSLYHTMLAPNLFQDTDGRYRGMDLKIHEAQDFDYYTVFSLWDTYRAAHPLYTIIEQERSNDFINTFLAKYDEGGIMPIWDLCGWYTGCMIGYHAVPVIADAYLKGIRGYDANKALEAMMHSAEQDKLGLKYYKEQAFIPVESESESVSKTLEYAFDDWSIAQMAAALNKKDIENKYLLRAQNYKNVYDPSSTFMRGRHRNKWFAPFDPYQINYNYTEANAWHYRFYVPQDISGLINLMGGKSNFEQALDATFMANEEVTGSDLKDITGLIGQYVQGNEPSHHMSYLYNFVNKPFKTQKYVHQILTEMYTDQPDGLSGNEDCGQMSAWFVMSSMGFYPVTPASTTYIIGSPLFPEATINLENGKTFKIIAKNVSDENYYIQSVTLNGASYPYAFIDHTDIVKGGVLEFKMGSTASDWGTADAHIPVTAIEGEQIVTAPFITEGEIAFKNENTIALGHSNDQAKIYYALGNGTFQMYSDPITLSASQTLRTYAELENKKSPTLITEFKKIDPNISLQLDAQYAKQYNAGGELALIDGIKGGADYRTGTWQGFHNQDVVATLDLSRKRKLNGVKVNFLNSQKSWIFSPTQVELFGSNDGKSFVSLGKRTFDIEPVPTPEVEKVDFKTKAPYRYVRIKAHTLGPIPEWHLGHFYGGKSWIFMDEIEVY